VGQTTHKLNCLSAALRLSTSIVHPERLLLPFFFCLGPDTLGACSMLPRDLGGVVDPRLKVSKKN